MLNIKVLTCNTGLLAIVANSDYLGRFTEIIEQKISRVTVNVNKTTSDNITVADNLVEQADDYSESDYDDKTTSSTKQCTMTESQAGILWHNKPGKYNIQAK